MDDVRVTPHVRVPPRLLTADERAAERRHLSLVIVGLVLNVITEGRKRGLPLSPSNSESLAIT